MSKLFKIPNGITYSNNEISEYVIAIGDDGVINSNRTAVYNLALNLNADLYIGTGDHAYYNGTVEEVDTELLAYWGPLSLQNKFYAVPGNHDNDTLSGEAFFNGLRQQRFFSIQTELSEWFFVNTGITTAMTQSEPANAGPTLSASDQFSWLRQNLLSCKKQNKFVVWHHPPITSGNSYYPGVHLMSDVPLYEWGATALFCGHVHLLERSDWNGLPVFVTGAGGQTLTSVHEPPLATTKFIDASYGLLEIRSNKAGNTYVFKDQTGVALSTWFQPASSNYQTETVTLSAYPQIYSVKYNALTQCNTSFEFTAKGNFIGGIDKLYLEYSDVGIFPTLSARAVYVDNFTTEQLALSGYKTASIKALSANFPSFSAVEISNFSYSDHVLTFQMPPIDNISGTIKIRPVNRAGYSLDLISNTIITVAGGIVPTPTPTPTPLPPFNQGLRVWLDGAYYTGTDNWEDHSGNNNNGILVNPDNAITWVNTFSGVFESTGEPDNYIQIPSISFYNSDFTVIGVVRFMSTYGDDHRTITANNNWVLGTWNHTNNDYFVNDGWIHGPEGGTDTNWHMFVGTGSFTGPAKIFKYFKDGIKYAERQNPYGPTVGHGPDIIQLLGDSTFNESSYAQIGLLLAYDRVLSDAEIVNVFNSYRSRYGL